MARLSEYEAQRKADMTSATNYDNFHT